MDKNLDFLTKLLVDQAVTEIDKNCIPSNREGKGYVVSIGEKQYPFKLIVTEAAKIAGIDLTSNDFSSSEANRNGFQKLTNYPIIKLGIVVEYSKFKKLLEYFVAHLERVVSGNDQNIGFEEYILPLTEHNNFKRSGQGYAGAKIQLQIKEWENYTYGQICINVQPNFGDYKSAKSYLNWRGTGLNIIANWSENKITSLYQEEYLYWEKNPTRKKFGKEITLNNLGLFDKKETVTSELIDFFENFETSIVTFNKLNVNRIMTAKLEPYSDLINYKKQIILQGPPGTGKTRLAKQIAAKMLKLSSTNNLKDNNQFKLIQFHPSYTYEDFVRGIVAESKGEKIEYKNVNKILGLFADEALKNYKASHNTSSESNIDIWIDSKFEEFKNNIEAKLPEEEIILSGEITIFEVTDSYFKYAKSWQNSGYLKFSEFKKIVKAIILGEFELSNKQLNKEKFVHAHYRYTYYNSLLKIFFEQYSYQGESYSEDPKNYILIIDEINRANLSTVLGELIYALEYRGESVDSIYTVAESNELILPPNLYIIGTMNTADRSVGHIDYAIRRRFAFVDVLPKSLKEELDNDFDANLFEQVAKIFVKSYDASVDYNAIETIENSEYLNSDFEAKDVWLGHSYFIRQYEKDENGNKIADKAYDFKMRLDYEIKPILLEYVKDGILKESAKKEIAALKISI
jgi:hypothetical protein